MLFFHPLSMSIVMALISILPSASAYNLYENFPVPKSHMNGRTYPQNDSYLYSGTTPKRVSLGRAVNAMLGAENIHYQTYSFMKVLNCLMASKEKKCLKKGFVKYLPASKHSRLKSTRDAIIRNFVIQARQHHGGNFSDYQAAAKQAQEIMDSYFATLGKKTIYNNFVKYRYTIKNLWPETVNTKNLAWPSEVIYSSLQSYIAAMYGGRVIVFLEDEKRSLDLGHWNLVNSGHWYSTRKDMGEFVTAGYMKGSDIVGYELRAKTGRVYRPSQKRFLPVFHKINFVFYKEIIDGIPYVLALQSNGNDCIKKVAPFNYLYCQNPNFKKLPFYKPKKLKKYKKDPAQGKEMLKKIQKDPNFYPPTLPTGPALIGAYLLRGNTLPKNFFKLYHGAKIRPGKKQGQWMQKEVDREELATIKFIPFH